MKILLAAHKFWPSLGGTQRLAYGIARGLVERGHEVTVITSMTRSSSADEWHDGIHVRRFRRVNMKVQRPWYITPGMFVAALEGELSDYDVVHAFHFVTFQALFGALYAGLTDTRFVITPSYHPWRGAYETTMARRVVRRADAVVAQCVQERELLSVFVPASKIVTIPCGVDENQFSRSRMDGLGSDFRSRLGLTPDDKVILYVGDVGGHKSVSKLVSVMPMVLKEIPEARLVVVGGGSGHDALRSLATTLGVERSVRLTGQLAEDDLTSAFRQSDVFAMPSENESFGMVILEAAVSGLPIVSTPVGVAPELVKAGSNGFLADKCDDVFGRRLIAVLSDRSFHENAQKLAPSLLGTYGWTSVAASLEALYLKLLNEPEGADSALKTTIASAPQIAQTRPSGDELPI